MKIALVTASLLAAAAAHAAPARLTVLPFAGPQAAHTRNQVVAALCRTLDCVPQSKVTERGAVSWRKVRTEAVEYVLMGAVVRARGEKALELSLWSARGEQAWKARVPVDARGNLDSGAQAPLAELRAQLEPSQSPDPGVGGAGFSDHAPSDAELEQRRDAERTSAVDMGDPRGPWLVATAGLEIASRSLAFLEPRTSNLPAHGVRALLMPRLHAELYPLRRRGGVLSRLGVEADVALAPMQTVRRTDGALHLAGMTHLEATGVLPLRPWESVGFSVSPLVGVRTFGVYAAPIEQQPMLTPPNVTYTGLKLGVALELKAADEVLGLFLRGSYLPVLSGGEMLSEAYFPQGGAGGFEAIGGLSLSFAQRWAARASVRYTEYGASFQPPATAAYVASGASDRITGVLLSVERSF